VIRKKTLAFVLSFVVFLFLPSGVSFVAHSLYSESEVREIDSRTQDKGV
jgi:hypothetical protein